MRKLRKLAKRIPIIPLIYKAFIHIKLKFGSTEQIFTNIYKKNHWDGKESISGSGSDSNQTKIITKELSSLFKDFNISTVLDIPCGDFNWMKNVNMNKIHYTGADVVKEIIKNNTDKYEQDNIHFLNINIISDPLPKVDLIFVRDCLVHFSFKDIYLSLNNICKGQSKYFLTTTFTNRKHNKNINTGDWRTLNLEITPFFLPKPIKIIYEDCTE